MYANLCSSILYTYLFLKEYNYKHLKTVDIIRNIFLLHYIIDDLYNIAMFLYCFIHIVLLFNVYLTFMYCFMTMDLSDNTSLQAHMYSHQNGHTV